MKDFIIGRTAYLDGARFERPHTGSAPEPSEPVRGWGYFILEGLALMALFAAIVVVFG